MISRVLEPWSTLARSVSGRAWRPLQRVLLVATYALTACHGEPRRERLQHGRFQDLELRVPDAARGVVLVVANAEDAALAESLSVKATARGAVVARVDAAAFATVLNATPGCVFPSGDLDNLAHFVEAYLKLPSYEPAILVGVGLGARLAADALAQAPVDTFAGAILVGGCASPGLRVPICPRDPTSDPPGPISIAAPIALGDGAICTDPVSPGSTRGASASAGGTGASGGSAGSGGGGTGGGSAMVSAASASGTDDEGPGGAGGQPTPGSPGAIDAAAARVALEQFPAALGRLAEIARAHATAAPSDMADLPITEVVAAGGDHPDTFGVLLSGDGGWAGIDKALSARLARHGLPIVGIDSLRYFWTARTPESTAADLDRVIRRYQAAWKRDRVVLMGYSQGADVLPFILNRLPSDTRAAVVSVVALSLSTSATFEFHVSNWIGATGDRPTLPEVQRLAHGPLVCVYGREDRDALCPALQPDAYRIVDLPGDHHFGGDYDRLTTIVLESVPPG